MTEHPRLEGITQPNRRFPTEPPQNRTPPSRTCPDGEALSLPVPSASTPAAGGARSRLRAALDPLPGRPRAAPRPLGAARPLPAGRPAPELRRQAGTQARPRPPAHAPLARAAPARRRFRPVVGGPHGPAGTRRGR